MKFKTLLIPLISFGILSTTGCSIDKKARITYGTLVGTGATELNYGSLALKVQENENMLIATYQDSGTPCACWTKFKSVIDKYVQEYNTVIYFIARSQFNEDADTFGLTIVRDSSTNPTFALIKNGKKTNEFIYSSSSNTMFTSVEGLREVVTKIARDPQYLYVNQEYLDNALFVNKDDKVVVHYIWNFCPDCNYCFPNVMLPYSEKNDFKTKVWIIDLGIPGLLLSETGEWQGTGIESYVTFLREHHMSEAGDEVFGYNRGFVPTTQVWEKGVLKDMNVYFNDEISKENGKFVVSRSYFSESRKEHLAYTNTVLEGIEISEDEVEISESTVDGQVIESYSWKKDSANKKHQPLLESFLDHYVL